jgi:hypothetical protein
MDAHNVNNRYRILLVRGGSSKQPREGAVADIIDIEEYFDEAGIWSWCVAVAAKRGTTPMSVLAEYVEELARECGIDPGRLDDTEH